MTRKLTLERTFPAPIEDAWELWTTKPGLESWWGPDGFRVEVMEIDVRPGGVLRYAMIAVEPDKIAFMKQAGMPVRTESLVTYQEVVAPRRLAYVHAVDFVPGVAAYDVTMLVELSPIASGVRIRLTFDAMHDELWTGRAVAGWENELDKLAAVLIKGS